MCVPTATASSTPTVQNGNHVQDLSSEYLKSSEYRAVTAVLEPIVDGVEVHNGNYTMNCARDSYATNVLWQVCKSCILLCACSYMGRYSFVYIVLTFECFQFLVVAWRSGLKMWRNPMTNILQVSGCGIYVIMTDYLNCSFL